MQIQLNYVGIHGMFSQDFEAEDSGYQESIEMYSEL